MESLVENKSTRLGNPVDLDAKAIQPCLGYTTLDNVKRTFDCTTQLAKWHTKLPFQRH